MEAKVFWTRIKTMVKQNKMTQEELAKSCGISINTWRGWVYKGILPGVEHCVLISDKLKVSLDYLLKGQRKKSETKIAKIRALLNRAEAELNALI